VKGLTNAAFSNSVIAADNIGSVRLASVATNNGGVPYGLLANSALTSASVTKPAFTWKATGAISQSLGDFRARRLAAVVMTPAARVLAEADLTNSTTITSNATYLFNNASTALQGLQAGDVLVGGVGRGFLVKVVSSSVQGGLVTVQTAPATLADAIQEGAFDQAITFTPTTLIYQSPGVTVTTNQLTTAKLARARAHGLKDMAAKAAERNGFVFDYSFDNVSLGDGVTLNGSVDLTVNPNLSAQFSLSGLQSFSATLSDDFMADVDVLVGGQLTSENDYLLAQYEGTPFLFFVGLLPVVVVPTLELHAGYNASVMGGMELSASLDASLTAGAQWQNPSGWTDIWTPSATFTSEAQPPSVSGSLEGYVKPEIVLAFYGTSGPEIDAEGSITLSATADANNICWSLDGDLSAGLGIDLLSIGDLKISYEKTLLTLEKEFAHNCVTFSATTLPATEVTPDSATLNGEVNPGGFDTQAFFEWGTNTDYGHSTTAQAVGDGKEGTHVSFSLTGIQSNITNHFRLFASHEKGMTNGEDLTFSTQTNAGAQFGIYFDDLYTPNIDPGDQFFIGPITNGYNGFDWNNFGVIDGLTSTGSGYNAGIISPNNLCFNEYANPASFSSEEQFDFYSAYLTAGWNDGLQVEVQGYDGSSLVYDNTYSISSTTPTLITFNYLGVTEVLFSSSGGTHNDNYNFNGEQFTMDNVAVATNSLSLQTLRLNSAQSGLPAHKFQSHLPAPLPVPVSAEQGKAGSRQR
jgi:hypothetical protein